MANAFSVDVPSFDKAFASGEEGYSAIRNLMQAREQDAARRDAQEALVNGDTRGAIARLIGANDPKLAHVLSEYHNSSTGVYGTPIMLQQPDGSYKVGAIGKGGEGRMVDFGQGNSPTVPSKSVDTGTGTYIIPGRVAGAGAVPGTQAPGQSNAPQQSQPTVPSQGYFPKDVAGEAREKRYGTEVGERQAELGKAKASLDSSLNGLDRLATQANEVLKHPGLSHITGLYGVLPNVPGFAGADAQAKLNTLKSQVGFSVLQAMRDASKTGGALGSITEGEHKILQNNLAELENAQSGKQFKEALGKIVAFTEGSKDRLRAAYNQDYANLPKPNPSAQPTTQTAPRPQSPITRPVRVTSPDQARRFPSGTPIILPDGTPGVVP